MKRIVFKYKRWYCRMFTAANILIPVFVLICGINSSNIIISIFSKTAFKNVTVSMILTTIAYLFFLTAGITYTLQTIKTGRCIEKYHKWDKNHTKPLMKGIILHTCASLILLSLITAAYIKSTQSSSAFKYLTYVFTAVTLGLCMTSNIFIHWFEAKSYSKIFWEKYKDTDIKKFVNDMYERKKYRAKLQAQT